MKIINSNYILEYHSEQLNHCKEELCGDVIGIQETRDFTVLVLADGLGSGIRANILANLTVEIALRLTVGGLTIQQVVETIIETLPVCPIREIAYSTFTIIQLFDSGYVRLYEFDNPQFMLYSNRKLIEPKTQEIKLGKFLIHYSEFRLKVNDFLMAFSDGVTHCGMGKTLAFGWERKHIAEFMEKELKTVSFPAKASDISKKIINSCLTYDLGEPGDDTSVLSVLIRNANKVTMFTGPPKDKADDAKAYNEFIESAGTKVVCGGTTSQIVSAMSKKPIKVLLDSYEKDIPAMAQIQGTDLVTEGVITISKVCEMLEGRVFDYRKSNGAIQLFQILRNADYIKFIAGMAINAAYQNPELPQILSLRKNLIDKLVQILRERYNKQVDISYY